MEEYAISYKRMIACLKIAYNDVSVLHHNVIGTSFFGIHEELNSVYDNLADMIDDLVESGMTVEVLEPSISESLALCPCIEVKGRNAKETAITFVGVINNVLQAMEDCKNELPFSDIVNKIEEYQYYLRKEALYKFSMVLA